jgi:hypothetical protein
MFQAYWPTVAGITGLELYAVATDAGWSVLTVRWQTASNSLVQPFWKIGIWADLKMFWSFLLLSMRRIYTPVISAYLSRYAKGPKRTGKLKKEPESINPASADW